jgi:hypothetical protein
LWGGINTSYGIGGNEDLAVVVAAIVTGRVVTKMEGG